MIYLFNHPQALSSSASRFTSNFILHPQPPFPTHSSHKMSNPSANPTLYGKPRPKSKEINLLSSSTAMHSLSAALSSARADASSGSRSSRRPATSSTFSKKNTGTAQRAAKDAIAMKEKYAVSGGKKGLRIKGGSASAADEKLSEWEWEKRRQRLEQKAEVYEKLKRGVVEDLEGERALTLVDWEGKWAKGEKGGNDEVEENEKAEEEYEEEEMVEYTDEFGRTRKATKRQLEKEAAEREREAEASVRPEEPSQVIFGDVIQTHAFQTPEFVGTVPKKSELEALLPKPEDEEKELEMHYDASKEVRTKGVGFYQFSKDAEVRRREMEELLGERGKTEREKAEKEERRKRKREELEKRKEEVRAKRRGKVGGNWLEREFGVGGVEEKGEGEEK